jgi:Rps23 Pro-64 3,4-dihydroxylase Tpa1-like proline 4-hydroxylase
MKKSLPPSLTTWLNPDYLLSEKILALQKSFLKAKPYPHLQLPNFLKKEIASKLLKELKKEQFYLKESDLFTFFQTNDLISTKNPFLQNVHSFLKSPEFTKYLSIILSTSIKKNSLDLAGTLYLSTHHLLPHDDQLENRKIAFMFYLTSLKKKDGGALGLYSSKNNQPTTISKRYQPTFNTFILFKVSPLSFHEVEEVITNTPRITLSGWFHGQ